MRDVKLRVGALNSANLSAFRQPTCIHTWHLHHHNNATKLINSVPCALLYLATSQAVSTGVPEVGL